MRFIRSRFGLVLWCAIALIILAVPLWRLRATRQWQGSVTPIIASFAGASGDDEKSEHSPNVGMTPEVARRAARQSPADAAAQLLSLQTLELNKRYIAIQGPISLSLSEAQLKAKALETRPKLWKFTDDYFAHYDALERRFPDSNLVRAQRLRDTMMGAIIADEGPMPSWTPQNEREDRKKANSGALWISPDGFEAAIETARAGARLEPDNAFFPWMEAVLQFGSGHNAAALKALESAGRCTRFDDYNFETAQSRIELLKRLRVMGWEDDFTETSLILFPHLAKMRSMAHGAMGQMRLARARGDEKTAFRWAAATARAGAVAARSERNTIYAALAGQAVCVIAWDGAAEVTVGEPAKPPFLRTTEEHSKYWNARRRESASRFAAIARARGDNELARATLAALPFFNSRKLVGQSNQPGAIMPQVLRLAKAYWLGAQLLRFSLLGALIWLACWTFTRKREVSVTPLRAQVLPWAMFGAGATGALFVGALALTPALVGFTEIITKGIIQWKDEDAISNYVIVLRDYWPALIAVVWTFVVFGVPLWARVWRFKSTNKEARQSKDFSLIRVALTLVAIALATFVVLTIAANAPFDVLVSWLSLTSIIIGILVIIGASLALIWRAQGPKRAVAVCSVLAFWLLIAVPFARTSQGDGLFYAWLFQFLAVALVLISPILALRIWQLPVEKIRAVTFQIAARTRIAAAVLALLCAVAYFGITLWTIPVEAKTRAMMQRQLQIGEVAWLREQVAAKN